MEARGEWQCLLLQWCAPARLPEPEGVEDWAHCVADERRNRSSWHQSAHHLAHRDVQLSFGVFRLAFLGFLQRPFHNCPQNQPKSLVWRFLRSKLQAPGAHHWRRTDLHLVFFQREFRHCSLSPSPALPASQYRYQLPWVHDVFAARQVALLLLAVSLLLFVLLFSLWYSQVSRALPRAFPFPPHPYRQDPVVQVWIRGLGQFHQAWDGADHLSGCCCLADKLRLAIFHISGNVL